LIKKINRNLIIKINPLSNPIKTLLNINPINNHHKNINQNHNKLKEKPSKNNLYPNKSIPV
jgi:hypothetical protein